MIEGLDARQLYLRIRTAQSPGIKGSIYSDIRCSFHWNLQLNQGKQILSGVFIKKLVRFSVPLLQVFIPLVVG